MSPGSENKNRRDGEHDRERDDERDDERDVAWLLARARGEATEHPDPVRAAEYVRLEQELSALARPEPSKGWQAKVLATIEQRAAGGDATRPSAEAALVTGPDAARRESIEGALATKGEAPRDESAVAHELRPSGRSAWAGWRAAVPLMAAALVAAALWAFLQNKPESHLEAIAYRFERANTRSEHRGDQAAVGETLLLQARPESEGELRLYRDRRELVLRCPGGEGCALTSERGKPVWRAKAPLKAPGRYRAIVLSGAGLPAPSGNEDQDLGAAIKAGAKVESASFTVL